MPVYLDTRGNSVLSVAICDRCSRKFAYTELMPDPNFPGMRVCKDDLDKFDPWRLPARQTENIALRFPRPDTPIGTGPVGGQQLVTDGGANNPPQNDSFFIDGTPYGVAGAPGDLTLAGGLGPTIVSITPSITSVNPNSGTKTGGTPVLINGNNLLVTTSVTFGGVSATFTVINSTQISCTSPAYSITGTVDIKVTTPDGTATSHGSFTYN